FSSDSTPRGGQVRGPPNLGPGVPADRAKIGFFRVFHLRAREWVHVAGSSRVILRAGTGDREALVSPVASLAPRASQGLRGESPSRVEDCRSPSKNTTCRGPR